MALEVLPLSPTWERRYLPERTAWAQLAIWVSGTNLCENILDGAHSIRADINVPLAPLVDWLVRSWTFIEFEERPGCFPPRNSVRDTLRDWGDTAPPAGITEDRWFDARELWWTRHFLSAGADGARLPNISLVRSGDRLVIEWGPANFPGDHAPRFLSESGQEILEWYAGEEVLAEFARFVAEWLRREDLVGLYPWVHLSDPLRERESRFDEKLHAYTGIDPRVLYEWTDTNTEAGLREGLGLPADGEDAGGSVITQVLRDLPPGFSEPLRSQVWRLDRETGRETNFADGLRATARDAAASGDRAESSGHHAASVVRHHLGLDGKPIEDVEERLRELGAEVIDSGVECLRERMLVGFRQGLGAVVVINRTPRTEAPWGRRFESARALGHLLMDSFREDTLGAASSTFAQPWTRRRSGAFAAELLLPEQALLEEAGHLDSAAQWGIFARIMKRYGVGARTAAFQLWNHRLLSSYQVRDELIDCFSGVER
ncbi:MAG: ImmA/IrrE family metallo-endopeptidase [Spirochaetaceae bacterium]|nr:ImmA/IrrE family metallo-endopeptidase [Spirochaetaceae bacterium]